MTVLVTGGAGFIGANFIYYMLNKYPKYRIVCIDKITYAGNVENLSLIKKDDNFIFYKADICDRRKMSEIFDIEKPDIVVNFSAESHVDNSIKSPNLFIETNVLGTTVLLDLCREKGIIRFHQVSTDEVYGDMPLNSTDKFTENSPLNAHSPYSASKASADLIVLSFFKTYNLPVTISRCTNNYGRFQFPEKLIPLTIVRALENKNIPIYGTGKNVREWISVFDHSRAIDYILFFGKNGKVYNVGSGEEKNNIEIVEFILNELNKPLSLIEYVEDRKGHDLRYSVDFSLVSSLGYKPTEKFEIGLRKTIKWYVENREWWTNILTGKNK